MVEKYKTPKKYLKYPPYIIGNDDIIKHVYNIWKHLQNAHGIRISTQSNKSIVTNNLIAGWITLGLQIKAEGTLVVENKSNGQKIFVKEIILEKIPRLRGL